MCHSRDDPYTSLTCPSCCYLFQAGNGDDESHLRNYVLRSVELPSISLGTTLTVDREQLAGAIRHKRNKLIFVTRKFLGLFILAV